MPRRHIDGSLNGTSPVMLIHGPANGSPRANCSGSITNEDSATVTIRVIFKSGTREHEMFNGDLAVNQRWSFGDEHDQYDLDKPDEFIQAVMSAAPATTNPTCYLSWDE